MAARYLTDVQSLEAFDCTDSSGIAARWERWLRAFELFVEGKGITNHGQKKALLLHTAGMNVQDIFFTLPEETEGTNSYVKAVNALNKHFKPQANVPYERLVFRETKQTVSETIEQYVTRLRQKAHTCDFGDSCEEQIRDQVISGCVSHNLRLKLLQKGGELTLSQLREIARAMENAEKQAGEIEGRKEVNRVLVRDKKRGQYTKAGTGKIKCYRGGLEGHKSMDKICKAWGQTCRRCKGKDHFERVCKSKQSKEDHSEGNKEWPKRVRQVEDEEDRYAFTVRNISGANGDAKIGVNVGGIPVEMIIDSGATCNIIDQNLWEYLKSENIKCESTKCHLNVYSYGSEDPLPVLGKFSTRVSVGETNLDDIEFIVMKGCGQALLGRATASALGVLKLGPNVQAVSKGVKPQSLREHEIFAKYPGCYTGIGKLKDYQLKIPIDNDVQPVAQPMRRVPYQLRDKLSKKLDELLELDIIEEVSGPSSWVSPVVVIPKGDDIRLCVDMRRANSAVKRERYPVPTVDEVLQDLNNSKYFSKLDLNSAYHQIELDPDPEILQHLQPIKVFVVIKD